MSSRQVKNARQMTAETLENMFVYLGCANIPTQVAMDGAVPLESLMDASSGQAVSCFTASEIQFMPPDWNIKAVWFRGENLGLSTVENVHWSAISMQMHHYIPTFKRMGLCGNASFTDRSEGFVRLFYSEIDRFGRFLKFPVDRRVHGPLIVKQIYNPDWLLEFTHDSMNCVRSASDAMYSEKRISFLAPFLCGLAQSIGSYWLVRTRFDSVCPSLTLLTDPTGVKEFWKLRDIPEGKKRRSALLHWVGEHWRQMRNDPDVETFVRSHMRGQEELTQGRFSAKITPSVRDTIDEERKKQAREDMRKRKEDKRRRRTLLLSASRGKRC